MLNSPVNGVKNMFVYVFVLIIAKFFVIFCQEKLTKFHESSYLVNFTKNKVTKILKCFSIRNTRKLLYLIRLHCKYLRLL